MVSPEVQNSQMEAPVRELQVGQVFRPFEGLVSLPQEVLSDDEAYVSLVDTSVQFLGVRGRLVIFTAQEDYVNTETPLGSVRTVTITTGNTRTFIEAPVELRLEFPITTIDEYRRLVPYVMEFALGEGRYYLRCGGVDVEPTVSEDLKGYGGMELFDSLLKPMEGEDKGAVLLPYDINKLAGIEARIVEQKPKDIDY